MKSDRRKRLGRRGLLKSGSKLIPGLAVLGLALTLPLAARADCDNGCEGGCSGTCTAHCAADCEAACTGQCQANCTTSCSDGCSNSCQDSCKGHLTAPSTSR